jgi:hypothetical protein
VSWVKKVAHYVEEWWGYMSGALSVPFGLLALFNVSQRLLFGTLAYTAVWGLVISQGRRISKLQDKRNREVEECVDRVCELLQNPTECLWIFNAICLAGAYKLAKNDQLVAVCDELKKNGHDHPFEGIEDYVPQRDWLEFVKTAVRRADVDAKRTGKYLLLVHEWPELKGYPKPREEIPLSLTVKQEVLQQQGL